MKKETIEKVIRSDERFNAVRTICPNIIKVIFENVNKVSDEFSLSEIICIEVKKDLGEICDDLATEIFRMKK